MPSTLCSQRGISHFSSESTPHKIFNLVCHQSLLRIGFSISIIRGLGSWMGQNMLRKGAWWDYRGQGTMGKWSWNLHKKRLQRKRMTWGWKQRQDSHWSPNQKIFSGWLEDERENSPLRGALARWIPRKFRRTIDKCMEQQPEHNKYEFLTTIP